MLVLTRKSKQQIRIGEDITITLLQINGGSVRVGIDAPQEIRICRGEIAMQSEPVKATANSPLGGFLKQRSMISEGIVSA